MVFYIGHFQFGVNFNQKSAWDVFFLLGSPSGTNWSEKGLVNSVQVLFSEKKQFLKLCYFEDFGTGQLHVQARIQGAFGARV